MSFVLGNNESDENNVSEMIKLLTSNEEKRIADLQIYLDKEWQKNKLKGIENLDTLLLYCCKQAESFDWHKYLKLGQKQFNELSQKDKYNANKNLFFMELLAKGYILNNKISIEYSKKIESDKGLQIAWSNLLQKAHNDYEHNQAKMLLSSGYDIKLKYLLAILKDKINLNDKKSIYFLSGISGDKAFISQIGKEEKTKKEILMLIQDKLPLIQGTSEDARNLRSTYIRFFVNMADPVDALKWIKQVVQLPNLSEYEKNIIKRNTIPILENQSE